MDANIGNKGGAVRYHYFTIHLNNPLSYIA